jgi:hypothetical protein
VCICDKSSPVELSVIYVWCYVDLAMVEGIFQRIKITWGKHERKRKRKYRKLFSNLDVCYPPRSVCPRARIVNDKLFNCRKKYL